MNNSDTKLNTIIEKNKNINELLINVKLTMDDYLKYNYQFGWNFSIRDIGIMTGKMMKYYDDNTVYIKTKISC